MGGSEMGMGNRKSGRGFFGGLGGRPPSEFQRLSFS